MPVKAEKTSLEGEIVKKYEIETTKPFGDKKMAKNIESLSLSRRTVTRQISDIQCQVQEKLKHAINNCKYFTACLYVQNESTVVTDVNQLLTFARTLMFKRSC